MFDLIRQKVLLWTTTAAATLTGLQVFAPPVMDWLLDGLVVCLVFLAAKLAKPSPN